MFHYCSCNFAKVNKILDCLNLEFVLTVTCVYTRTSSIFLSHNRLNNLFLGLNCWISREQRVKRRNDFGARFESMKKTFSVEQERNFSEKIASPWRICTLPTSRPKQSYVCWKLWLQNRLKLKNSKLKRWFSKIVSVRSRI